MPEEVFDVDRLINLSGRAEYCALKRLKKSVKLKLRTPRRLYTMKINPTEAEGVVKKMRCDIVEV